MIDLDAIRADTPACNSLIHFNNAGASLMPQPVYQAVTDHLQLEVTRGGYEAAHAAQAELDAFYQEFATLLNASPDEIAYVENATRAWDMAFYGLPLQPGDRILTHESEYSSNYLAMLQQANRKQLHIDLVPSDASGQIDVDAIDDLITDRTRVIALTHVPTQGGLINPAVAVGKKAKALGLIYMLDACQSAGQVPLDVQDIQCDVLSGTGRKFLRGPRGTGFLYVNRAFLEQIDPPFVDLHTTDWTHDNDYRLIDGAKRFENWESYVAGRVGLTAAVRYANAIGMDAIRQRVDHLATTLRAGLSDITGVDLHDQGVEKSGIVTFTKSNRTASDIAATLKTHNINVSVTNFKSARIDLGGRNLQDITRSSVHYFNNENEIDRFCETVKSL